jgi:MYXO-CTERM domain-containing protein
MKNTTLGSLIACGAIAGLAGAATVDVTYNGIGYGEVVNIVSPGYSGGVNCGQLLLTLANSGSGSVANGNYIAFCTDVYQGTNTGPHPYSILPVAALPLNAPMGAAAQTALEELYAYAAGAQYGNDAAYACAFQLAVWEIVNDLGNLDLSNGAFQASGYSAAAAGHLAGMFAAIGLGGYADIVGLGNETYQDYIIEVPGPGALALVGMAGIVGRRRRRN